MQAASDEPLASVLRLRKALPAGDVSIKRAFSSAGLLARLRPHLPRFGITRLADVTGLDRIGLPVAQSVRPLARSNVVNQGKGHDLPQALLSAALESLETFAAETDPCAASEQRTPQAVYGARARAVLRDHVYPGEPEGWERTPMAFRPALELASQDDALVPAALVSTDFRPVSRFAASPFIRSTTGLGAGATVAEALTHAVLEAFERLATAEAMRTHGFFERFRFDPAPVVRPRTRQLLSRIGGKHLHAGCYLCPSPADLPVVWARILDAGEAVTSLPFPADGFACRPGLADAIDAALLEALQTRLAVISGGRDDIGWKSYETRPDAELQAFERRQLARTPSPLPDRPHPAEGLTLSSLAAACEKRERRCVVVPLLIDERIPLAVVRAVLLGRGEKP